MLIDATNYSTERAVVARRGDILRIHAHRTYIKVTGRFQRDPIAPHGRPRTRARSQSHEYAIITSFSCLVRARARWWQRRHLLSRLSPRTYVSLDTTLGCR